MLVTAMNNIIALVEFIDHATEKKKNEKCDLDSALFQKKRKRGRGRERGREKGNRTITALDKLTAAEACVKTR